MNISNFKFQTRLDRKQFGQVSNSRRAGYIAITTVLIVGAVSTLIMSSVLLLGITFSKSSLTTSNSKESQSLATSCAEEALRQIRNNPNFTATNTAISLGNGSCHYTVTNTGGTTRKITTDGQVNGVIRNLEINITALTPKIIISSWTNI